MPLNTLFRKRALRWMGGCLAALALAWLAAQAIPPIGAVPGRNPFRAREDGRPLVIAHGGGLGLHPGNTLEAFRASMALGCDMLEMDVRLTKDDILVTHHNATVDATSEGKGAIRVHALAELKALNFGYHFRDASGAYTYRERPAHLASLEELFVEFSHLPMVIELKDRAETGRQAASVLAELVEDHRMTDRVVVASFDDATLDAFRQASRGRVATSTARAQTRQFVLLALVGLNRLWPGGAVALQVPSDPAESAGFDLARPGFIRAAHARNLAVHYWTVNDTNEMRRLMEMGADGLMTDYPDRLKKVLAERGRFELPVRY